MLQNREIIIGQEISGGEGRSTDILIYINKHKFIDINLTLSFNFTVAKIGKYCFPWELYEYYPMKLLGGNAQLFS